MSYSVTFSGLDSLLQSLAVNTVDTPYDIEITQISNSDVEREDTTTTGKLHDVLQSNSSKYVNLSFTEDSGLTAIKGWAFKTCYTLTGITIPAVVTSIDSWSFVRCVNIKFYSVAEDNTHYISDENGVLYSLGSTTSSLTHYPIGNTRTGFVVPGSIESKTIVSISPYAFLACSNLESIELPNTITSIGEQAFFDCSNLTTINIPSGLTEIREGCFRNCANLAEINLPNGITTIGASAFNGCSSLEEVVMPLNLTSIGNYAFKNCTALTSIECSAGLTTIGTDVFSGCTNLISIKAGNFESFSEVFSKVPNRSSNLYYDVEISTITNAQCTGASTATSGTLQYILQQNQYKNVHLSFGENSGLTAFGNYALYNCTTVKDFYIPNGITSIGNYAFANTKLSSITIPNTVTVVGQDAFANCTNLTTVSLPNSLTSVTGFAGCTGLTTITIPSNVTEIGIRAFAGCTGIETMSLPNGIRTLGAGCFQNCTNLETVNIPTSVTSINSSAFKNCSSLQEVLFSSDLTGIGSNAFENCVLIESITIPSNVTSIGNSAFKSCTGIETLIIQGAASIGESAFEGCSALESISILSVPTIGTKAFYHCTSLVSLKTSDTITRLGESAFEGCSSLTSIELGSSLQFIYKLCFKDCTELKTIKMSFQANSLNPIIINKDILNRTPFYNCGKIENLEMNTYAFDVLIQNISGHSALPFKVKITQLSSLKGSDNPLTTSLQYIIKTYGSSAKKIFLTETPDCFIRPIIGDYPPTDMSKGFKGCSYLVGFTGIPRSVTNISEAFYGCTNLNTVEWEEV